MAFSTASIATRRPIALGFFPASWQATPTVKSGLSSVIIAAKPDAPVTIPSGTITPKFDVIPITGISLYSFIPLIISSLFSLHDVYSSPIFGSFISDIPEPISCPFK